MVSGEEMYAKDMAFKYGQMEQNIKDNGLIIKHKDKASLLMSMVISTMVNGNKIKHQVTVCTFIITVQNIKVNGLMIINMEMVFRLG